MKRSLHFAGRAVGLQTRGPLSLALADFLFGRVPASGHARARVALRLEDCAGNGELCFSAPPMRDPSDHPGYQGLGSLSGPAELVINRLLSEVDYHLADGCRDGLYLHAASLARAGQALLLPAGSGRGKSTLAYWLSQHGFQYLSDEASFIPLNTSDCAGLTRPAHLKTGSLGLFPELQQQPKREVRLANGHLFGWLVDSAALNPAPPGTILPLKQIVFPRFEAGSALEVERLTPARAAFELAGCLINARNLPEHGFPQVLRLARSLPAWRLVYGDLAQLGDLFEKLA